MKNLLTLVSILILASCKNSDKTEKPVSQLKSGNLDVYQESMLKGKELMESKCYVCHGPEASEDSRIAPPMVAIKARYLMGNPSKEEFGNAIWNFVEKPSMEKGKMKGALKRFGVMPYQPYSEEEIRLISDYIYEFKIEEPEWFKEHWEKGHEKGNYQQQGKDFDTKFKSSPKTVKEIGLEMALSTQKVLGKNLMGKMQKEGPVAALKFCNEKAYPLTDSMAIVHGANIKRVSDRARNPMNRANTQELKYIAYFKERIKAEEDYEPISVEIGDKTNFYYPIITNDMCLKCHGKKGNDIRAEVVSILQERYPEDEAIGYSANEVRGIWSIVLEGGSQR
ncbi:c-type heme family protein [Maribacter cobaltidurans]|uniref:Uncharacterized protein n=1 Tax=Maribacter cobaltidurans TaxID=1178778 RepID=A0A223V8U0_9FLAO|nr:DUF3365 domain-containing protein [Maribacter cobaltidurans]ASV31726.1 hypothetical protein CJ263_16725 [Maribacter cobaltidurans]GGD93511.1 hypothetical protein GCM10011412_34370 [Maribacter cobaltidurans]